MAKKLKYGTVIFMTLWDHLNPVHTDGSAQARARYQEKWYGILRVVSFSSHRCHGNQVTTSSQKHQGVQSIFALECSTELICSNQSRTQDRTISRINVSLFISLLFYLLCSAWG